MKSIFPYNEKIVKEGGAFVKPDGEFIMACYNHEGYARDYCDGYYAKILEAAKKGEKFPSFPTFEDIKKIYGYEGNLEDIDIYLSSNLTKEQLKLYKLWLELNRNNR